MSAGIRAARMFFDFRNQINAAASERVATRKTFKGKPGTVPRSMKLHGSCGIPGTGRIEFAGAWQ
jgi:hypothetical protein